MINLGIIFGGQSVEHDISIITFNQVINGINKEKYNIIPLYLDKNNIFREVKIYDKIEYFKENINKNSKTLRIVKNEKGVYINKKRIDFIICTCHGKDLENGVISGFLKLFDLPNAIPNIYTSSVFHNKYLTKAILKENRIPVLKYYYITKSKWESDAINITKNVYNLLKNDLIIKPVNLGSSIGIKVCKDKNEFRKEVNKAFTYDDAIICEEKLNNFREFNQAIYKSKDELIASTIEEIINENSFYGFKEKYQSDKVKRILPADIEDFVKEKISKMSKKIYEIFNDIGVIRIDYLYDVINNKLYVNEINVIPGALSYYLFEPLDIYFDKLLDDLIYEGIKRKNRERELILSFNSTVLDSKRNKK